MTFSRVLVLAPHTDDGEFGCGGTIARLVSQGAEVAYVALSTAEESIPTGMDPETTLREVREATHSLGIPEDHLFVHRFPVRKFPEVRQEILQIFIDLARDYAPDCVFLPSTSDTHQDHQVVAHEGFRAFKRTTMFGYEVPWNNLTFTTNAFFFLEPHHVASKIEAVQCYISQLGRSYVDEGFIRALARTRGVQIGAEYAEAFEAIRWVMPDQGQRR
ncbi:MAG: PIG-L family deacetylase [Alphaproteobacteria bacterium]|nr:PIG-L family deacetylase [Alphaproteobacteria bacterium]